MSHQFYQHAVDIIHEIPGTRYQKADNDLWIHQSTDAIPDGPIMAAISPGKTSPEHPLRRSLSPTGEVILNQIWTQLNECALKSAVIPR